ncbi:MAG: hypothetical protein QME49_04350 [bacterium]|nr:hypothetical protein [bacterium]
MCLIILPFLVFCEELILEKAEIVEYKGSLLSACNSEFTWGNKRFLAKNLLADISSKTIKAEDVAIFSEGWHLSGKEIEGREGRIEIRDGWFTACPAENPHYRFTSKRITLTNDKVKARNLTFRIMDIPIFWLPTYSYNLKEAESPYTIELGKCNKKGIFLKSKYLFQQEFGDLSLSADFYQKRAVGLGGKIKKEEAEANLYYADEGLVASGLFKSHNIVARAESYKDQNILVSYLDQKPKDEVKNLLYLEKSFQEKITRIGLNDKKIWNGKNFEPESRLGVISFSSLPQPIGGLITDSEASFSTDGNSELTGKIGRGFSLHNLSFFQQAGFLVGYKENKADEALTQASNIRGKLWERFEWNIGYDTSYSLEKSEMTERNIGLSVFANLGKARLKIGTEFDCKTDQNEIEIESDVALENGLSLSFDGIYSSKRKERVSIGLAKEKVDLYLSILAKEEEELLFYPSLIIRPRQGVFISANGYILKKEIREIKTKTSFLIHCLKMGFNLSWRNKDLKVGLDLSLP